MQVLSSQESKVHLISLGCARNRADSEVMLGSLINRGWQITEMPEEADAIVINTCGFIQSAKEESIDTILEAAEYKKQNPEMKLVVSGCLTQRYKTQLAQGLPEVDLFVGTDEFPRLPDLLTQPLTGNNRIYAKRTNYLYSGELPKKNTLSRTSAYVKVAEGCQHNCAFCIIPAIRGRLRSRPVDNVVKEVEALAAEGVLEINLIAQDLAAYGRDFKNDKGNLLELLKRVTAVPGIQWVRPLYVYPENISDDFIEFFANSVKLVKYLDIPVQHASNNVLARMNRGVSQNEIRATIQKLRARIPEIAIRTSVMVGFPGETEEEFNELKAFVREMKFNHLGCFSYSQEEGTVAGRMKDQVPEEVKKARLDEIMTIQREVSRANLQRKVGTKHQVLVVGPSEETEWLYEGRLSTQAPEVDGIVYINDGEVKPGSIQLVEITEAHDYDLVGHVVELDS